MIDAIIPTYSEHIVFHGDAFLAMILNVDLNAISTAFFVNSSPERKTSPSRWAAGQILGYWHWVDINVLELSEKHQPTK